MEQLQGLTMAGARAAIETSAERRDVCVTAQECTGALHSLHVVHTWSPAWHRVGFLGLSVQGHELDSMILVAPFQFRILHYS